MLQRWLGTGLLYCEQQFKRVNGFAGVTQVIATIMAKHAEPRPFRQRRRRDTTLGRRSGIFNRLIDNFYHAAVIGLKCAETSCW
jgi:hypothetical protein